MDPLPALEDAEQLLIEEALKRSDGNQGIAAQLLEMSRQAEQSFAPISSISSVMSFEL